MNTQNNTTTKSNYSDGSELKPAEVAARENREGSEPPNRPAAKTNAENLDSKGAGATGGYTVDRQGLVDNVAKTPQEYPAKYPSPQQQRNYAIAGAIALLFVGSLIVTAFFVS